MTVPHVKRRYDASRRQAQSRQLRLEVVATARELLIEQGYASTTMGEIATAAGVSPQFLYAAFGTKPKLLNTIIDWTLVGDDEPIPMAERPSILAIRKESTITGKCALHAHHVRLLAPRITPTLRMLRAAADADTDAREIYETGERQRHVEDTLFAADLRMAGGLRLGVTEPVAADAIWALVPDVLWDMLVQRSGWTPDNFEVWYARQISAAVLADKDIPTVGQRSNDIVAETRGPG